MATFSTNGVSLDTTGMMLGNAAANMVANSTTLAISSGLNLINRTLGANIGDLIEVGGLASAFDGNYDQSSYACAVKTLANVGYIGKTLSTPSVISKAVAYGSNNVGYVSSFNVSLYLYGKVGAAPANAVDGTLLANISFLDINGNTNPVELISNNLSTKWNHAWVTIVPDTANTSLRMGELEFYGIPNFSTIVNANGINAAALSASALVIGSINANGSVGSNGQLLTSNGSIAYWSTLSVVNATTSVAGIVELATAAEYRIGTDTGRVPAIDQIWASADYGQLTDAATIVVNCATFSTLAICVIAGNRTLANTTNGRIGQQFMLTIQSDASARILTLSSGYILWSGVEIGPYTIPAGGNVLWICGYVGNTSGLSWVSAIGRT